MQAKSKGGITARRIVCLIGMGIGLLSVIFGIVVLCTDVQTGGWVTSNITYGADYYTDSYAAMARAANNSASILEALPKVAGAVGYVLIVAGMTIAVCFVLKFLEPQAGKRATVALSDRQTAAVETEEEEENPV